MLFRVAVKQTEENAFCEEFVDYMQGRVKIKKRGEYYAPFKE